MSDALNFAEIDGQRVELLPARIVLSLFGFDGGRVCPASAQTGGAAGFGGNGTGALADAFGVPVTTDGAEGNPGSAPESLLLNGIIINAPRLSGPGKQQHKSEESIAAGVANFVTHGLSYGASFREITLHAAV